MGKTLRTGPGRAQERFGTRARLALSRRWWLPRDRRSARGTLAAGLHVFAGAVSLGAVFLAGGCDEGGESAPHSTLGSSRHPTSETVRRHVEKATAQLDRAPSAAWPTQVRSLQETMEGFESVEGCLSELRDRTPTAVAEGIADLSYDGFFDDVCRGMAAVKAGSAAGCDELGVSSAQRGCRRRLALLSGDFRRCPDDRSVDGREPVCVAWAARAPALCRAAPPSERARCRAVLEGEVSRCASLRDGDRRRCEAEVRRYASALGQTRESMPAAQAEAVFRLEVREEGDPGEPLVIERDVLARGVRLVPTGCRYRVVLARPVGELPLPVAPGRFEPTFHLELLIPAGIEPPVERPLGATDAVLSLAVPAYGGFTSATGVEGAVALTAFEPRLGGAVTGTFHGTLRRPAVTLHVTGRFATFVRDVDPLSGACP